MQPPIAGWRRALADGAATASFLLLMLVVVLVQTTILNEVSREPYQDIKPAADVQRKPFADGGIDDQIILKK